MKKFLWVAVAVLLVLGIFLLQRRAGPVAVPPAPTTSAAPSDHANPVATSGNSPSTSTTPVALSPVPPPAANPSGDLSTQAGAMVPVVADTNAPQSPPAILESMRRVIRSYNTEFGENPVGNNSEITASLMGNNPRHINFVQPDTGLQVNGNGELVDAWGTPFFFHQVSGQDMEIHSAGPDRIMWTSDDLVTH